MIEIKHLYADNPVWGDCCNNPNTCWEPCGDLGKDIRYAIVYPENYTVNRYDFDSMKGEWKSKEVTITK